MRFSTTLAALFAAVTAVSAAQVAPQELPQCALGCLAATLTVINCTIIDSACMCGHATQMSENMSPCLLHACSMDDVINMAKVQAKMCDQQPESRQRFLVDMTIGCFIVQVCFIIAKFFTRGWIQRKLWLDDWILMAAIISPFVGSGVLLWTIDQGLGVHLFQVKPDNIRHILGGFLISEASYPWTLGLVRISLLVFLLETFPNRRFQLMVKTLIGYTILHTITFFVVVIFQCTPIPYAWDKTLEGTCVNLTALTYVAAILSAILDVVTALLPINELRKLHMSLNKKIGVIFIFIIGSCGCIAGFVRVKEIGTFRNISQDADITWDYVNITYWTEVEITAMILCTCIPSLRPLVIKVVPNYLKSFPSKLASYWTNTVSRGSSRGQKSGFSSKGDSNSQQLPRTADSSMSNNLINPVYPVASMTSLTPSGAIVVTTMVDSKRSDRQYDEEAEVGSPGGQSRGRDQARNYDDAKWLAFPPPMYTSRS